MGMMSVLLKKKDLGKAIFNLTIRINCDTRVFKDTPSLSAQDHIDLVGIAIHDAKLFLKGNWHVTEQGYLVRDAVEGVKNLSAVLDADHCATDQSLLTLREIIAKRLECEYFHPVPHIHFDDGGIESIGGDVNGLYIASIQRKWAEEQNED